MPTGQIYTTDMLIILKQKMNESVVASLGDNDLHIPQSEA